MLHQIGIGALGPVFRTYEPTRDRLVAVKVFRLDIVPEQAQALAEALTRATQSSLFHPSIVEPIAAGVEGTLAYRAEEYVAAESLDVAMRHYAPAPLDKALPFITQLAGAIDFARAAGVGHGGLHPRDIFMTPDEARATGFGVVEALEQVGVRAPTRRPYAAPERIAGTAWSTPADIFALAAITYELLTGRRPSGTGQEIGALPDAPHAEALHAVLARAMDEDPAKRFTTALGFVAALEAAGRGQAVAEALPAAVPPQPPVEAVPPAAAPPRQRRQPARPARPIVPDLPLEPTPGEFEVEKELDPVLTAIDDDLVAKRALEQPLAAEPGLFDQPIKSPTPEIKPAIKPEIKKEEVEEEHDRAIAAEVPLIEREPVASDRFDHEFVEEQEAEADARRPLEAVHETVAPVMDAGDTPIYGATASEPDVLGDEHHDRSRPFVLPLAVGLMIGLLGGFGGGYLIGHREPGSSSAAAVQPPAASQPTPVPTGVATPEQPGQYSEQKLTPPSSGAAVAAPPSKSAAPPIPNESAGTARPPAAVTPPTSTRTEPAVTRGRLVVKSTPARAGVTVNGTWRGRTPLTLDNLAFGRYVVRVVQPGFNPSRYEVTISARDAAKEIAARLERTAPTRAEPRPAARPTAPSAAPAPAEVFTGSLFVDSRPRGATVFVDGRNVGETPLSIPGVAIGSHIVRLEMAGKKTWSSPTRVTAGQTARVTGSLEDR